MGRRFLLTGLLLLLAAGLRAGERAERLVSPEEAGYPPYLRYAPEGPRLDWLLVTPAALVEAFAPLVAHRRDLGLAAEVVTVEEVRRDILLGGGDFPERLRNLVRELHARWGLKYLVLGGDTGVLPPRMLPFGLRGEKVHHGEPYAGDAYYGCLDGEWNADADDRFGEAEPGNDDRPDVTHEVHVGRIPVENPREAAVYVEKLLRYERPSHLDYQDRVAYLGGKVFTPGDADHFYRQLHEDVFGPAGFSGRWFTKRGEGATLADVQRHLSAGVGILCHYHHSFSYNLSLPQGAIDTGNVAEIRNAERPFVMWSNGCYANQFTKESISEKLLLSAAGGCVAFVGSTNTCFSSSLALEARFWPLVMRGATLGEALSAVRGSLPQSQGVMGFLRLSFNLLGDPATRVWRGRPSHLEFEAKGEKDGRLRVTMSRKAPGPVRVTAVQPGPHGARRDPVELAEGAEIARFPAVAGNGRPIRVTVSGAGIVPRTLEVPDPVRLRVLDRSVQDGAMEVRLSGDRTVRFPLPEDLSPGPLSFSKTVGGAEVRVTVPVLDGSDVGYETGDEVVRYPGFDRLAPPREHGVPLLARGPARLVAAEPGREPAAPAVRVEGTDSTIRIGWTGEPGARWLVERRDGGTRRLLTPLPLVNPVFELSGLPPLSTVTLFVSRLGRPGGTRVEARTTFPFQAGFPQRIGSSVTSVQLVELDGRRGKELVFGDDAKGLWALHADGREVRHAGDNWTFGLFAAIEGGVFEPIVADISGSRAPEILAVSKRKDRKLYAFRRDGTPLPGFPVAFRSRLMTPPLVGEFDGKRGAEILVVSGFGKTIERVRPDGRKEAFATIGQYNYAYPLAVNLDRDRALEVVLLDGDGKVWSFDGDGAVRKGFPVDLGGPGRATPMVANLDRDRNLEIVALAKGTTRIAVIDGRTGKVQADLAIPGAGKPANHSFFYPALARLGGPELSIVAGTPSKKLFAFDLRKEGLVVRKGYPLHLPAEARGVAAVDIDGDGRDELFLSLHDGEVWGLDPDGRMLPGFPLATKADTYAVPLLEDLDGDGDLELFLGAADGVLRVWDLPYRIGRRVPTWRGLLNGAGLPGIPDRGR